MGSHSSDSSGVSAMDNADNGGKAKVPPSAVSPPKVRVNRPSRNGGESDAEETLKQLEKVVSEFMIRYPAHTQRIPSVRPGEHPMISFVRTMAASMAKKQDQLEKLNAEIVEATEEKERFLANMSHEVRTPMNGIFGMVNLLLEMDLDLEQREYMETIRASSESLLNVLDDILDYAKLNANELKLRPREFAIYKLVRDVLLVYQPTAEKKGIELSATICESLPERFVADDLRLKQVLSNLVSNAIKFTEKGEVTVTVRPAERSAGQQLLFQVSDSGIGISAEAGKKLFAPFRQVEPERSQRFEGTGLGLAISRNLVELMGGCVWFESEVGTGTTFFFTVAYEEAEEPSETEDSNFVSRGRVDTSARPAGSNGRIRALLVEDNMVNQKVASLTLEQLGCEVTIASDGREAVDLADGPLRFDLICMDVNMPNMDGLEATRRIRNLDHENSGSHILAMTGMAFEDDRKNCFEAGMDDVVTKPFEIEDLRKRVNRIREAHEQSVALPS